VTETNRLLLAFNILIRLFWRESFPNFRTMSIKPKVVGIGDLCP